jgi:hypothetical protein
MEPCSAEKDKMNWLDLIYFRKLIEYMSRTVCKNDLSSVQWSKSLKGYWICKTDGHNSVCPSCLVDTM